MGVIRGRDFWLGAFTGAILTVLAMEPATNALRSLLAPDARLGAEDAWTQGSPAGCRLNLSTDLKPGKTSVSLAVGESVEMATGIGPFRIILAGVPDGLTCVVDIMKSG